MPTLLPRRASAALTMLLALASSAAGQKKPVTHVNTFASQQFDSSLTRLPPHYLGHAAGSIFLALRSRSASLSKSEFETTQAFDKRTAAFMEAPLVGGMRPSDTFAFSAATYAKYDADTGTLKVTFGEGDYLRGDSPRHVSWSSTSAPASTYVGSNAFGVEKVIRKVRETEIVVDVDSPSWLGAAYVRRAHFDTDTGFILKVPADQAARYARSLRVLLVGTLAPPFSSQQAGGSEPTISAPVDVTTVTDTLFLHIAAVWLYDGASGDVIAKFDQPGYARDWPVRATVQCSSTSCAASGLRAFVDGDENKGVRNRFSTDPLELHGKRSIRLTATSFSDDLNILVEVDGAKSPWQCAKKTQYSSLRECSLEIQARQVDQ